MPITLSERLTTIDSLITEQYDHIWDTCCDHGLLGMYLLEEGKAHTIHFVDQIESITKPLQLTLQKRYNHLAQHWRVHTQDCAKIQLMPANDKHLVIIAGVGGKLTIELVQAIVKRHKDSSIEFLLCPIHHAYELRESLSFIGCQLIQEKIVEENNRYYETIHVSFNQINGLEITATGQSMWDFNNSTHNNYINTLIKHYQNKAKGGHIKSEAIAMAYKSLKD